MTNAEALLGKKVTLVGFRRKYVVVGAPEANLIHLAALEGGLRDSELQVTPDEVEISLSQNKAFVGSVARQLKNTYDSLKARFDNAGVPYHNGYIRIGESNQPKATAQEVYEEGVGQDPKARDMIERLRASISRIAEMRQAQTVGTSPLDKSIKSIFSTLDALLLETIRVEIAMNKTDVDPTQKDAVSKVLTNHIADIIPEIEKLLESLAHYLTKTQQIPTPPETVQQKHEQVAAYILQQAQSIAITYRKSLDTLQAYLKQNHFYADAERRMAQESIVMPKTVGCLRRVPTAPDIALIKGEITEAMRFVRIPQRHQLRELIQQITPASTLRQIREISEEALGLLEESGVRVRTRVDNHRTK